MNKKFFMIIISIALILLSLPAFTWDKIVTIPYYSQSAGDPGPAAAKMILESPLITAHPAYVPKTQAELWTYISAQNLPTWTAIYPGTHSDPIAMRQCLIEYDTRPAFTYGIYSTSLYSAEISQKIVSTLDHYSVPPAVPIDGGLNWVAVFGVQTDVAPSTGPYTIDYFIINDPRDPILGNNRYISYTAWENSGPASVFRHIATPDPYPDNMKKMAICDPNPLEPLRLKASIPELRRVDILTPDEARNAVLKALTKYRLLNKPDFKMAKERIKGSNPILVRRKTGGIKSDYYIVPLTDRRSASNKMIYGAILIDAYSGAFLEASCPKNPIVYPYLNLPQTQARTILIKKIQEQEGVLEKDIQAEIPTLIWEPGMSVNPYFPIWETSTTIKGITTVRHLDFENNVRPLFLHKKGTK
ncbi:MAG TPA: hypothetical protein VK186_13590 [Candidatus Deferrimicrobium sp.]|nr:hypothetical protein [Candidatus Deferrimicrobium sp.]